MEKPPEGGLLANWYDSERVSVSSAARLFRHNDCLCQREAQQINLIASLSRKRGIHATKRAPVL